MVGNLICLLLGFHFGLAESIRCEVGQGINKNHEQKWIIPVSDVCKCSPVVMGGFNTRTRLMPFNSMYVDYPVLSSDTNRSIIGCGAKDSTKANFLSNLNKSTSATDFLNATCSTGTKSDISASSGDITADDTKITSNRLGSPSTNNPSSPTDNVLFNTAAGTTTTSTKTIIEDKADFPSSTDVELTSTFSLSSSTYAQSSNTLPTSSRVTSDAPHNYPDSESGDTDMTTLPPIASPRTLAPMGTTTTYVITTSLTSTNAPSSSEVTTDNTMTTSSTDVITSTITSTNTPPRSTSEVNTGLATTREKEVTTSPLTSTNAPLSSEVTTDVTTTNGNDATTAQKVTTQTTATSHLTTQTSRGTSTKETVRVCDGYLGMENGDIPDSNIDASSKAGSWAAPAEGRLNNSPCWATFTHEIQPWIEADIGYLTNVTGIVTQGGGSWDSSLDWVTLVTVSTIKRIGDEEVFISNSDGTPMEFLANTDATTPVTIPFLSPVYARIVRITCMERGGGANKMYWSLRFEIIGCKDFGPDFGNTSD